MRRASSIELLQVVALSGSVEPMDIDTPCITNG